VLDGFGGVDDVRRAVRAIEESSLPVHEVIVSESSVLPQDRAALAREFSALRLLETTRPGGTAFNEAAAAATGSHVVFLEPGVRLAPDFLEAMRQHWERLPSAVRGKAVLAGSLLRGPRRHLPMEQNRLGYLTRPYRRGEPLTTVIVSCTVFPRALFDELGFLDVPIADYAALGLIPKAVVAEWEIVSSFDAANFAEHGQDQRPRWVEDAARIRATAERRAGEASGGSGPYFAAASLELFATMIGRHGVSGAAQARKALRRARPGSSRSR
jgi:hypothetical protein